MAISQPPFQSTLVDADDRAQTPWVQWFSQLQPILQAVVASGPTSGRPTQNLFIGYPYFDTTIDQTVYWNGVIWVTYAPSTTGTSILKGNGTGGFNNAIAGVDFAPATSGTAILYGNGAGGFNLVSIGSGITFAAGVLSATGSGGSVTAVTGTAPIASSGGPTPVISISQSGGSSDGYLSSTDWNIFNNKGSGTVTSVTGSGNIASSGGITPNITFTGTLPIANGGTNGTATPTAGAVAVGNGTQYAFTTVGLAGQVLTSNGSTVPTWATVATGFGTTGHWGSFWDTTNQTAVSTTVAYPISLNNTDANSNGISIVSSSSITFAQTGVYNVQYALQFVNTNLNTWGSSNTNYNVKVWIRKNGIDIIDSNSIYWIPQKQSSINGTIVGGVNHVISISAGDYIQILWQTSDILIQLSTLAAGTSPTTPENPSARVTATPVIEIGIGYYNLTSVSSAAIATGSKTFTTNLSATSTAFTVGTRIRVAYVTTPANFMEGVITSFSGTTLNVNVDSIGGSGTYANWTISVAGIQGSNGVTSITGTASQVVASPSTGAVTLSLPSSINVNTTGYAAGLAGGGANYVPYQTAVNTTGFVSPGVVGQVFTSTGSGSAPNWQNATSPPGSPGYYGAWHDTSTVTATSTTTAYVMNIGSIDLENGTSIVGGTKLTVANTAVYNLQFSSQLSNPNAQIADVSIWIRLNGVNVTDGAGTNGVPAKHGSNNGLQIISWNYVLNLTAGDYIELVWHSDTTGVQLITFPATTSPAVPESPSLIVTIQAVTQIGIGYQGLTSATSVLIATGSKVFTTNFTNSQTAFAIGTRVRVAYSSTPANFMEGVVTAFSGTTFTVLVDSIGGSGTFASWTISVAGSQGSNGVTSFSGNSTGLTPSTATTGAITLAGTLVASNGGTGVAGTLTGLLYGNGTSAHTVATTAQALTLIGTVPVVNGGTGLTSLTAGYIPYGNGTGALSSSSNLFFNATGLGIGTSSPSTKLHVAGAITAGATTGEGGEIDFQNAAGTSVAAFIDVDGSNNFRIYNSTASASIFYTNNAPRMTIDASGNVGIGTSSPSTKLDVNGTCNINGGLSINGNFLTSSGSTIYANTGDLYIRAGTSGSLRLGSNGTNSLAVLDASGNVGIGTSSPNVKLHISGTGASIHLNDGTVDAYVGPQSYVSNSFGLGTSGAYPIAFVTNSSERMRIDASGSLLVGTTTAGFGQSGFAFFKDYTSSGNSGAIIQHINGSASGSNYLSFAYNATQIGNIAQTGTTGVLYNVTSDQRLKENIIDAPEASDDIDSIKIRSFNFKSDKSFVKYGFIAQELVLTAPNAVHQPVDPDEMMGVDYSKLVPMLIKEVQSLRARLTKAGL
jgi:hypothetical protein